MTPLPLVNKVFSLLIHQERQLVQPIEHAKLMANISKPYHKGRSPKNQSKNPPYNKLKGIKIWSYYNKLDHTIEVFFKNHDLPSYLKKPQS